jgi:serine/threonine protein phosphatase PrpC
MARPRDGFAVVATGWAATSRARWPRSSPSRPSSGFVDRAHRDRGLTWPFGLTAERSFEANCLSTGIRLANQSVYRMAANREELAGMGTTLVAVLARDGRLTFAGVGDSRVYLFRDNRLRQLTRDDSWIEAAIAQRLIDVTEREVHPFRHVLTKAIGLQEDVEFEVGEEPIRAGDRVLLCSDGLTTPLSDQRIEEILRFRADLESTAARSSPPPAGRRRTT